MSAVSRSIVSALRHSRSLFRVAPTATARSTRLLSSFVNKSVLATNSVRCGQVAPVCVRHMSTEEDLSNFLHDEIEYEKEISGEAPTLAGFKVDQKGTELVLTKKIDGETICVRFDVNENNNIDESAEAPDASQEELEEGEDMLAGEIVSYPHFTVSITKKSGQSIEFDCIYEATDGEGEGDMEEDEEEQHSFDVFKFEHVCILEKGQTRKTAKVYESETTNMDANLYSMLFNMLMDRGIDGQFVNDLLTFSTSMEHRLYLDFLQDLKGFVDTK